MRYGPPTVVPLDRILPEEPLLMMGAGPVPVPSKVAAANSIVINHLGETMNRVIEQVKAMTRYIFQTQSGRILGVAGPASGAMEMAVANLVEPGSKLLAVRNGFFSARLGEMAARCGAEVAVLDIGDAETAQPEQIEEAIKRERPTVMTIVQGETSNTVCNRLLPEICAVARAHGVMVIVDAVCTLSTMPMEMDAWGVDALITGGQKGLSSIPGVSLIAFSEAAWKKIEGRNSVMALHEALRLICVETMPARFHRHELCSLALQSGIEAMGLELHVPKEARLYSVVGINVPEGVSGDSVRRHMSEVYRVEIAGSFGLNILRIGQMGEQCRAHHIFRTLHAFGSSLQAAGAKIDLPAGVAALERVLTEGHVA
ncbi:MAG: alanine--glyoxylate aminotransferase family protein [Pseudomonadota bacterium]